MAKNVIYTKDHDEWLICLAAAMTGRLLDQMNAVIIREVAGKPKLEFYLSETNEILMEEIEDARLIFSELIQLWFVDYEIFIIDHLKFPTPPDRIFIARRNVVFT